MATVTISRSGDRLIAVKQVPAEHARDIEREAETLQRLAHPGVVRFVDLIETPDRGRALHTEFVSSDTWATRPITHPAERAAAVAALAEVIADLHDMGFAHGQINPSHVLHGDGDRPVLCGFRLATEATSENRRSDLVALADLCHEPAHEQGPLVEKLSALADAARAGRFDVRELARRLVLIPKRRSTAPETVRAAVEGTGPPHRGRPRRRLPALVAAGLCVSAAVIAAGVWGLGQRASAPVTITGGTGSPGADHEAQAVTSGPADSVTSTPAAMAALADLSGAAVSGPNPIPSPSPMIPGALVHGLAAGWSPPAGNPDPDLSTAASGPLLRPAPIGLEAAPSGEPASLQPGAVLEHGGSRYGIGRSGDFVETGDWNCDGRPTPAIIRPSTGHIVLFDGWPAPGQTISMPVRWEVDTATGAETVTDGPCDLLRVYTAAGSRLFDPMGNQ